MKICINLACISRKRLLDTIYNSLIIISLNSDNLFSLKLISLVPGFIPRPEWIVVPPTLIADILVGPKELEVSVDA